MIHSTILEVTSAIVFQQFFTLFFAGLSHSNPKTTAQDKDTDVVSSNEGIGWIVNQLKQEIAEGLTQFHLVGDFCIGTI